MEQAKAISPQQAMQHDDAQANDANAQLTRAVAFCNNALDDHYRGDTLYVEIPPWLKGPSLGRLILIYRDAGWTVRTILTHFSDGKELGPSLCFSHGSTGSTGGARQVATSGARKK